MVDIVDPRARHHLPAICDPAAADHFTEAGEVARRDADAAGGAHRTIGVDGDIGIALRAERYPEILAEDLGIGLIAGALIHPAEHVAIGRDVVKQLAMLLPVRPLQGEEAAQVDRRFARRQRIPSRSMTVAYHIAFGVFVVFVEGDADRHIQEMPDRAAGIDRRRKFGDVIDDAVIGVEQTTTGKDSAERAANRLAHGEDDVRRRGVHAVVVPLGRDPSAPEHDERVGTRGA